MTNDLEQRVVEHLERVACEATPAGDLDGIMASVPRNAERRGIDAQRSARQLLVAAAAAVVVAVGVIGLVVIGGRAGSDEAATSEPPGRQPASASSIVEASPVTTMPSVDAPAEDVFAARLMTPAGWEITAEEAGESFYRAVLRDSDGRSLDAIVRWADATDAASHDPVAGVVTEEGVFELGAGSYRLIRLTSDGAVDAGIRPVVVDVLGSGFDNPREFEALAASLTMETSADADATPDPTTTVVGAAGPDASSGA